MTEILVLRGGNHVATFQRPSYVYFNQEPFGSAAQRLAKHTPNCATQATLPKRVIKYVMRGFLDMVFFLYFWLCWGFFAVVAFLVWAVQGYLSCSWWLHCSSFSYCGYGSTQPSWLKTWGSGSCGSYLEHRLSEVWVSCSAAYLNLSHWTGINQVPWLAGRSYHWATREAPMKVFKFKPAPLQIYQHGNCINFLLLLVKNDHKCRGLNNRSVFFMSMRSEVWNSSLH